MHPERCDVAVVGGGPVGLWLGLRLTQLGFRVRVLERRATPSPWSRAIGVHPPALGCLAEAGVLSTLLAEGVRIPQADVYGGRERLGSADFSRLPGRFAYILSVPQSTTETALEDALRALGPDAITRGVHVRDVRERDEAVHVDAEHQGEPLRLEATLVVGCDGKHSATRSAIGARFRGGPHGDGFVMGDFPTSPELATKAFVVLSDGGVVESFPLPKGQRRWVVRVGDQRPRDITVEDLVYRVEERTGHTIDATPTSVVSSFEAEHFFADRWCSGRIALAGDAAHIVSPLGGQGMTLGLLDAQRLLHAITRHFRGRAPLAPELARYARERQRATRWAALRARAYLTLARPGAFSWHAFCVRVALSAPLRASAAATFAMART